MKLRNTVDYVGHLSLGVCPIKPVPVDRRNLLLHIFLRQLVYVIQIQLIWKAVFTEDSVQVSTKLGLFSVANPR